jgi:hypothetical protein
MRVQNLALNNEIKDMLRDPRLNADIMAVGWIFREKHSWGFLLNLEALGEAYSGNLNARWKKLLKHKFF